MAGPRRRCDKRNGNGAWCEAGTGKTSWPALLPDLLEDRFDIAAGGISITIKRQKSAFFSTPILQDGKTPITRCENAATFITLTEIDRPVARHCSSRGDQ
jgi:hypothetical protein